MENSSLAALVSPSENNFVSHMNVAGGGIDYDIGSNRSISSLESAVLDQKMDDIMGLLRHGGGNVDGRDSLTHQAAHRTRGSFVQQERAKPKRDLDLRSYGRRAAGGDNVTDDELPPLGVASSRVAKRHEFRSPSFLMSTNKNAGDSLITNLHQKIDDVFHIKCDIERKVREKDQVLQRKLEEAEAQARKMQQLSAALNQCKTVLKEKESEAAAKLDQLKAKDKVLKRAKEQNDELTEFLARKKENLGRIRENSELLLHEVRRMDGKLGSIGKTVESQLHRSSRN